MAEDRYVYVLARRAHRQTLTARRRDALGGAPDGLCLPVGNAGNISAYWMGFCRYRAAGKIACAPRLLGFQAAGAAPIVLGRPVDPNSASQSSARSAASNAATSSSPL